MYITLRHVERILATQPVSIPAMRGAPGWESIADAYQTLTNHATQLEEWSEQRADEEEERLRAAREQLRASQRSHLKQAAVAVSTLGVDPGDGSLRDLETSWPSVLQVVEDERREQDLIGSADPAAEHTEAMRARGRIVDEPASLPAADVARDIRSSLLEARSLQKEIQRAAERIEEVDPRDLDDREVGWLISWGLIPHPKEPRSRPFLDPSVLSALERAGIDLSDTVSDSADSDGYVRI
jgi:hypothetical protein